ncbi:MAG: hypothetical protein AB7O52_12790 [Planctomycetota bacterium]
MGDRDWLEIGNLIASTIIFGGLIFGVLQRRNRRIHIPTMISCFVADVLLVLVIELNREAVHQATTTRDPFLQFHVAVSVSAVVLYVGALITGLQRRHGRMVRAHRINAVLFLFCRGTNWVTAFFV